MAPNEWNKKNTKSGLNKKRTTKQSKLIGYQKKWSTKTNAIIQITPNEQNAAKSLKIEKKTQQIMRK